MICKNAYEIFLAGVEAAKPEHVIPDFLGKNSSLNQRINDLSTSEQKLYVLSIGKAGYALAIEFRKRFLVHSCFVYTKKNHIPQNEIENAHPSLILREGTHPIPSAENVIITKEIVEWLKNIKKVATLIVLLSGGGSALLEWPLDPFSIQDIIKANENFLNTPMSIAEINRERKKLSRVKGGKLLSFLSDKIPVITLTLSDVISDDPEIIASAPTYPGSEYYIMGNLKNSLLAAKQKAELLHYYPLIYSDHWEEDAKATGEKIAANVKNGTWNALLNSYGKVAILIGGEMVATVKSGGMGGRNQEACLSFAYYAEKYKIQKFCFLSAGTDGTDGPTPVAGAFIDEGAILKMKTQKLDPWTYLENSNSFPILKAVGAHITTGPTGTNVNDLLVLLLES